jgi:hypothetical protein
VKVPQGRDHYEDEDIGEWVILRWILEKGQSNVDRTDLPQDKEVEGFWETVMDLIVPYDAKNYRVAAPLVTSQEGLNSFKRIFIGLKKSLSQFLLNSSHSATQHFAHFQFSASLSASFSVQGFSFIMKHLPYTPQQFPSLHYFINHHSKKPWGMQI